MLFNILKYPRLEFKVQPMIELLASSFVAMSFVTELTGIKLPIMHIVDHVIQNLKCYYFVTHNEIQAIVTI